MMTPPARVPRNFYVYSSESMIMLALSHSLLSGLEIEITF
ncbi:hypothetical protein [Caulobacter phage Cr30]|nr:hypothetical protein OZ74_gp187 [Caulobacter phage Cr30]AGS81156.1 hypothetical protein [Caulobacter phage Cr30]